MRSNIEYLYEELRKATDGGSESMTHDDALKQIAYWRELAAIQPRKALIDATEKLRVRAAVKPVAWTVQMGIDLLKSGASITVFPESGERDVPLYTHPAPDHTALLRQALAALDDSREDVCECLNMVMEHAGYERYDKRIAAYQEQLAKHDAAIAAIEGALK